jgi:hypothetical protein
LAELLAVDEADAIEYAYAQGWTDGLPVVPPTRERVEAMLAACAVAPGHVLGAVPARRRVITAEIAAANAVMAGCRPDSFVLVLAALEAALDPAFNLNTVATSTGGAAMCVIVSGPLAGQVGMNGRHNVLGTGNRANATIGRALRLVASNALGAKTGKLDATSIGHPGKYTLCFAEDPPPAPWEPLRVQQGYGLDDTTVTVIATEGPRQVANQLSEDPEDVLRSFVAQMKNASTFIVGKGGQCVAMLGHEHALAVRQAGWTQRRAREYLFEHSRVTAAELAAGGIHVERGAQHDMTPDPDGRIATFRSLDDIILVTAGGPGAGWSAYLPTWAPKMHSRYVTRRVRLPGEALPDCGPDGCALPTLPTPAQGH